MPRTRVSSSAPAKLPPVYTIGHSTRSFDAFADLLYAHDIRCVIDVRRLPGSNRYPHFDGPALAATLAPLGIDYLHLTALGGRRGRSLAPGETSPNGFWENASFQRYADYAMGEAFHAGLRQLQQLASDRRCTLMCAEAVWWRCHRRIIADYLLAGGRTVCHILGPGRTDPARLTPAAQVHDGVLVYPVPSPGNVSTAASPEPSSMRKRYAVGDHVSWNSEAGRVRGTIIKVHTRDTDYKGHTRHCSDADPQYEIRSDTTEHIAMHKGSALRKLASKAPVDQGR